MSTELRLESIAAGYDGNVVIEDISLSVAKGERLGILGRNGAGKTTTLATALGFTQRKTGRVLIGDADVTALKPHRRIAMGIGFVPQSRDIFPSLSVEENLVSGLMGGPRSELEKAYGLFPRLAERRRNMGNQLSGGEQQMLSIARALMGRPAIILLDEPLEGLSPVVAQEVMSAISRMVTEIGLGCVLVEQNATLVMDFSDRVLVLERGQAAFYGASTELKLKPAILENAVGLMKVNITAERVA